MESADGARESNPRSSRHETAALSPPPPPRSGIALRVWSKLWVGLTAALQVKSWNNRSRQLSLFRPGFESRARGSSQRGTRSPIEHV